MMRIRNIDQDCAPNGGSIYMRLKAGLIFLLILMGTGCVERIDADENELASHVNQQVILNLTCQEIEEGKTLTFLIPVQDSYPAEIDGVIYTTFVESTQIHQDTYNVISTKEEIKVATKDSESINITEKEQEIMGFVRKEQNGDIYLIKTA